VVIIDNGNYPPIINCQFKFANKLQTSQRAMKRAMIEITLWDKIRNEKFRSTTKMTNVLRLVTQLKWRWAGPRQDDQGAE